MSDIPVNGDSLPNGFRELDEGERNPKPSAQPSAVDQLGRRICGAKCRGKDKTCRQPAMPNGRCKLHGGLTPGGQAFVQ